MKATDFISSYLYDRGVRSIFEMSGGMITHLLDSISKAGRIRIVSTHHEQAAAFAAEGVGRITGVPGIALATSGPGATNLITGIGSCYFDSTPAVFITGQVNRSEQKGDRAIRQLGFQETDIVSIVRPITKMATMVREPSELPGVLEESFRTALSGRPGPVLLDIPMDVQRADVGEPPILIQTETSAEADEICTTFLDNLWDDIQQSLRPIILIGGGIRSGLAAEMFRRFASMVTIPVVHSLMAVDVLPFTDPNRVGMIGTYGNRWANTALARADLVLVLGSRLDIRQTGVDTESFRKGKRFYHVDCEPGEMNNRVSGCITLRALLQNFFAEALGRKFPLGVWPEWRAEIADLRMRWPDEAEVRVDHRGINPNLLMQQLSVASEAAAAYVVDVGQHQMWAAQSLRLRSDQRFLTSGGMGAMGFALPAAVGAAVAVPSRPVVVIAGDGGFQTNIHELETLRRNHLSIKMIIVNNLCHGMVRQFQESYFDGRYQSTLWGYSAPNFERVAEAYSIPARTVANPEEVTKMLDWLFRETSGPALLQVMIDPYTNAYPKVAFGRPITDMEPFALPIEMEST